MTAPPASESTIRRAEYWATAWSSRVIGALLAPFQKLAKSLQLVGIDALFFQDIQDQQLVGVAEESANQVAHLEAGCVFAVNAGRIDMSALVLLVLHVPLLLKDADDRQHGVVGQHRLRG